MPWRIRAGELEKIVLAREVEVHAPVAHDQAPKQIPATGLYRYATVMSSGTGPA